MTPAPTDVVVVDAVRTPIGRRGGGLSTCHPADLLATVLSSLVERTGIDPARVGQVVGGCVTQVGEQSFNLARSLVGSGAVDVAVACGVEVMSRVPLGANVRNGPGRAIPKTYFGQYEYTTQFEGAERIAERWGISRRDADEFGLRSQERAAAAWQEGRFERELVPVDAPVLDDEGKPTGETRRVERHE